MALLKLSFLDFIVQIFRNNVGQIAVSGKNMLYSLIYY